MGDVITLETVKIERDGATTLIYLNRPEKRNAMSPQLHLDMCEALDWAEDDEETKVLVLTGSGEAFCAGQDLNVRGGDKAGHWSGAICDRGGVKSSQW